MTILLLLFTGAVVASGFLAAAALFLYRALRRVVLLGPIHLDGVPQSARPGQALDVRAKVISRRGPIRAFATLTCTMFDHRERRLFHKEVAMEPSAAHPGELAARLRVPSHALRSGAVGTDLSKLFSEEARRLLVCWTVGLEVRSPKGTLLARRTEPLELPDGEPLHTDPTFLRRLVVDTFASLRDDLLFNYLVALAARDGAIVPEERELLHEVLRTAHGIADPTAADARIEQERRREIRLEPALLRAHVPPAQRADFYRLLFALAWRDGAMERREQRFLTDALRHFGLDTHHAREIELEVLRDGARRELDEEPPAEAQGA